MVNDLSVNLSTPLLSEMEIISTSYEAFMYQCTHVQKDITLIFSQPPGVNILQSIYDQFLIISSLVLRIGSNVKIALAKNLNSMEKIKLISFNISNKFFEISEKYIKNTSEYKIQDQHLYQINSTIELIHSIRSAAKGISCLVSKEILKLSHHSKEYNSINIDDKLAEEKQSINYYDSNNNDISNCLTGSCIALFLIFIIVVSYLKINE